jgi:hypothetical protein
MQNPRRYGHARDRPPRALQTNVDVQARVSRVILPASAAPPYLFGRACSSLKTTKRFYRQSGLHSQRLAPRKEGRCSRTALAAGLKTQCCWRESPNRLVCPLLVCKKNGGVVVVLRTKSRHAENATCRFIASIPSSATGCLQRLCPSPTRCIPLFDIRCTRTMVVRVHEILIMSPNLVTYLSETQDRLAGWRMQRPVSPAKYRRSAATGSRYSLRPQSRLRV